MIRNEYEGRVGNAKLDEIAVLAIRKALKEGARPREIALIFGVSKETIMRVKRRDTWFWVNEPGAV